MNKFSHIEIQITDSKGNLELSPDNFDIREIISILGNAQNLHYPGDKIEFVDYSSKYDEAYLKELRDRAKNNWLGEINADVWLRNLRDDYEA